MEEHIFRSSILWGPKKEELKGIYKPFQLRVEYFLNVVFANSRTQSCLVQAQ
ncbi:hypothetical protein CHS0354_011013 [Potamilus streckersoni]|uniref:Uncharacterized protein n=1 Tax=Potamilus streckersoni TaxID=2493646 RepID=A0AAE0TKY0_9BIVA|nr:hypothetical protein CHS0354_011013 [Potamilus streckersoni]